MARNGNRGGRNNNPHGHNQYDRGWVDTAKERPLATAAAAAAAVGAGVFLWSRRNQITDQISNLSDQISDWRSGMSTEGGMMEGGETDSFMASPGRRGGRKSQSEISEEALTLKETGASSRAKAGAVR
jgi:hypothetical protein